MLMPSIFAENLFDEWFEDFPMPREMRQLDRKREKGRLENDIRDWKEQAKAERAKLDAEEKLEEEKRKSREP